MSNPALPYTGLPAKNIYFPFPFGKPFVGIYVTKEFSQKQLQHPVDNMI